MEFYRAHFPRESVTLKMRMIEDHALTQIKNTGFGLGLLSEQGGELLHRKWNVQKETMKSIKNPVVRLRSTLKKYLRRVLPEVVSRVRHPVKRKTKNVEE